MNEPIQKQELVLDQLAADVAAQAVVEGDAALPGSMRDAVTVLGVSAQAVIERAQVQADQISVSGQVSFHVLYTQGDLTRVQVLETGSDFSDVLAAAGVSADMHATAGAEVLEALASASGGRLHLRAVLSLRAQAMQETRVDAVTDIAMEPQRLRTRRQEITWMRTREAGRERTLLREEFDLSGALGVGDTLFATAQAHTGEMTGGEGRANVTGVIDLCVYHAGAPGTRPLIVTRHSMPFEVTVGINGEIAPDAQLDAQATLRDVLADSMSAGDDGSRVLRAEVELEVQLLAHEKQTATLLQDAYTLYGDTLALERTRMSVNGMSERVCAKDSGKMILTLPEGKEPVGTVLAAFALPVVGAQEATGSQLRVDGVLDTTVIYLPPDSGIPVSAQLSQAFTASFDAPVAPGAWTRLCCTELNASGITSDRIEARYVLEMCARGGGRQEIEPVTQVKTVEPGEERGGICVYFPGGNETMWDVARRYRVDEAALERANAGRAAGAPVIVLRRRHI